MGALKFAEAKGIAKNKALKEIEGEIKAYIENKLVSVSQHSAAY